MVTHNLKAKSEICQSCKTQLQRESNILVLKIANVSLLFNMDCKPNSALHNHICRNHTDHSSVGLVFRSEGLKASMNIFHHVVETSDCLF